MNLNNPISDKVASHMTTDDKRFMKFARLMYNLDMFDCDPEYMESFDEWFSYSCLNIKDIKNLTWDDFSGIDRYIEYLRDNDEEYLISIVNK